MDQKHPNLFIVGAPKCGTTAWVNYLSSHKDIYFSPAKEPHYFCDDFPNFRWAKTEEDYLNLFAKADGQSIIGEASVQYLNSQKAAQNIYNFNPDAKILIFLRKQRNYLPSYHHQLVYNHDESIEDFSKVWDIAKSGKTRALPPQCREAALIDYIRVGSFSEQYKRFADLFPAKQIKVIWFENWTKNPRETYVDILNFLGLSDDGRSDFPAIHGAKHQRFKWLARLTQRPPKWVLAIAKVLKKVLRKEKLGAASIIRSANDVQGYAGKVPESVKLEIDAVFKDDMQKLSKMLGTQSLVDDGAS